MLSLAAVMASMSGMNHTNGANHWGSGSASLTPSHPFTNPFTEKSLIFQLFILKVNRVNRVKGGIYVREKLVAAAATHGRHKEQGGEHVPLTRFLYSDLAQTPSPFHFSCKYMILKRNSVNPPYSPPFTPFTLSFVLWYPGTALH